MSKRIITRFQNQIYMFNKNYIEPERIFQWNIIGLEKTHVYQNTQWYHLLVFATHCAGQDHFQVWTLSATMSPTMAPPSQGPSGWLFPGCLPGDFGRSCQFTGANRQMTLDTSPISLEASVVVKLDVSVLSPPIQITLNPGRECERL